MPVLRGGASSPSVVYAAVRERIEADARIHNERGWQVMAPYPMQRILDALRAGKPTDVPSWALPLGMRWPQQAPEPWTFRVAIVHPDNTVAFEVDDGSRWLEYHGLL